jgi:hypothetical protein
MRIRALIISAAVTIAVGLGVTSVASAATLYTDTAHTTAVSVGSTASIANTTPWVWTSVTSTLNTCTTSTIGLSVDQNSGGTVTATFTSGTPFTGCSPLPIVPLYTTPWTLTISGSPTTTGDVTAWRASLTGFRFVLGGGSYSGDIETGVTARQTGADGHVCLNFDHAGSFSGPLTANGLIDANYCFEGGASSWSLG